MYPRVLRNVLNISVKLKSKRTLKSAYVIIPTLNLTLQNNLPIFSNNLCKRHFSNETADLPDESLVESKEKMNIIDQEAQKEIDELLKNPEKSQLKKIIELEISVARQNGERVPTNLRARDWKDLLILNSRMKRAKFLNYLFINEKKREHRQKLQVENRLGLEEIKKSRPKFKVGIDLEYGIGRNSFLRRVSEGTMNQLWKWNCLLASMFGNKIIFDCSYDRYMSSHEIKSCARQIMEAYASNKLHNYPFEINLCNVNLNGPLIDKLIRYIPTLLDDHFPINITSKSYLEAFKNEKLVYLTSNASNTLQYYNHNAIYIIGALVDRGEKHPRSLAKAKEEGLEMAKLPLDKYINFGFGSSKDLTLNQVMSIMLDAQTNDWESAMTHVPRRKFAESRQKLLERQIGRQNYLLSESAQSFESNTVITNDYSYSARLKHRRQWDK